jgi:hypothetical protein
MNAGNRRTRRRRNLIGGAFSGLVHVIVLAIVLTGLRSGGGPQPARPIIVSIMPFTEHAPAFRTPELSRKVSPSEKAAPAQPRLTPFEPRGSAVGAGRVHANDGVPFRASPTAISEQVRAALSCRLLDRASMTDAQRAQCKDVWQERPTNGPNYAVVSDPVKRAEYDRAARISEAFRSYRDSTSTTDYPGLRTVIPALRPVFGSEPIRPGQ